MPLQDFIEATISNPVQNNGAQYVRYFNPVGWTEERARLESEGFTIISDPTVQIEIPSEDAPDINAPHESLEGVQYYVSDAAAAAGGVAIDETYALDDGNIWLEAKGTIKARTV